MWPLFAGVHTIRFDNITVNKDTLKSKDFKK
jgi:hypothetical protein